ncbi:MAG: hypothetical protein ACI90V_012097, partial [Bacillariaceae sp.]
TQIKDLVLRNFVSPYGTEILTKTKNGNGLTVRRS